MLHEHFCSYVGPTLVIDGMSCLCHWYSCKDWVCGGQWKEYVEILKSWVEAFTSAGIRLVFFFDGVVEEQKRQEWVSTGTQIRIFIVVTMKHFTTFEVQYSSENKTQVRDKMKNIKKIRIK